jgi:hypothetical protein
LLWVNPGSRTLKEKNNLRSVTIQDTATAPWKWPIKRRRRPTPVA